MTANQGILLVDDDEDLTELVARGLRAAGFAVEIARDGGSALALLRQLRPMLVLLDLGLGKTDAYTLAREIKSDDPRPPAVIAMTGSDSDESMRRAKEAGFDDFLVKPVRLRALVEAAARCRDRW